MTYDWQRRWLPVYESRAESTDAASRAKAPQALWQMRSATDGVLFSEIRHIPCLILLGEPGIGKTYAVRHEQRQLDARIGNTANKTLWVDLSGCSSIDSVRSQLFERDNYRGWKAGAHRLTMFVDSVDQAGIPVEHVVTAIGNELADADVNRLQIRIVCRDYAWSLEWADALKHIWRSLSDMESKVGIFQLAPLDLDDIRLAAEANSSTIENPEEFVNDLEVAEALPLAMVPITLEMMLREPGHLTSRRIELYENGIKRLIKGTRELISTELDKRFEIASRIAALMMFGRKHAVDIAAPVVHESSGLLAVKDLLPDGACQSDERHIRETLDSTLFQGSVERTWAHLSYAEFLAARYLSDESISLGEILEMTVAPDGKFPSHLHDCLRWLIELRQDILPEVIARQPLVVLAGDLSHLTDSEFEELFAALLSLPDPRIYRRAAWNLRDFRAGHPSAKRVLLPYLTDTSRSPDLRYFVLRLVEQLDIQDIDEVLAQFALDENEDEALRRSAAHRICDVGRVETKLRLKPYIYGRDDDPDDELKGYALQALWPGHLTANELFGALSPRKQDQYIGSYRMFLFEGSIVNRLQPDDLPTALKWVAAQPPHYEMAHSLNNLPNAIMRNAWENIHVQGVMEAFAETAVAMITRFDYGLFGKAPYSYPPDKELDSFEKDFIGNTEPRRELALKCLPHLLDEEGSASRLTRCWPPVVVSDDLDWLLGLLDSEADDVRREQLSQLVAAIFPGLGSHGATLTERYRDIEKVYEARERHPELKERTQGYFIRKLDDSEAAFERELQRIRKEREEKRKRQHAEVRPFERLEESLDQLETGETWQWQNVVTALSHWPDGRFDSHNLSPDLTGYPLWNSCDQETQDRIVRAALSFVVDHEIVYATCNDKDLSESDGASYTEVCGYLAISLLRLADATALNQLPADKWKRWAKIVIWYSSITLVDDGRNDSRLQTRSLQKDIVRKLYEKAPDALLDTLRSQIIGGDRHGKSLGPLLQGVEYVWDSRLESMLLGLLQDISLSAGAQRSILDFLWSNECDEALRVAQARISSGCKNDEEKDLAVECSAFLMTCGIDLDWSAVWKLFQNGDDVGRMIVGRIAQEDWQAVKVTATLSARELADLYIWVEERYPTSEDPNRDGAAALVAAERAVYLWRSGIIVELRKKESQEALEGVKRILSRFPELEWMQSVRLDLEKEAEGSEWKPVSPREVLKLAPIPRERRFDKLRQWCRDNQAVINAIGVLVTIILLLLAVRDIVVRPSEGSEDPISVTPPKAEFNEFRVEDELELDSEGHSTHPETTQTDTAGPVSHASAPTSAFTQANLRPTDY